MPLTSPRAWKILGMLFVLLLAAAAHRYGTWRREPRFVLALESIGGGRAIVCSRSRDELWASATSIGLFDSRTGWVWKQSLPPDPADIWIDEHAAVLARTATREGLLVQNGRVIVRVPSDAYWTKAIVSAYAIDDGKLLWRTTVDEHGSGDSFLDVMPFTEGGNDKLLVGNGMGMSAMDSATGKVLWHATFEWQQYATVSSSTRSSAAVMTGDSGNRAWITDLETGAMQSQATDGRSCIAGGELLFFDYTDSDHPRLMARRLADGSVRVAVAALAFPEKDVRFPLWGCGRYRDRTVLMLGFALDAPEAMLEVDLAAGRQLEMTRLRPRSSISTDATEQHRVNAQLPENAPWTGELPRYVPLLLWREAEPPSLVVFDLEERRAVRHGPPSKDLDHAFVMKHGGSFTISAESETKHTRARLDGSTGLLTGAACTAKKLAPMRPFDRHGDELWLHTSEAGMPIAMLRGDTLTPAFATKLPVEDCRVQTEAAWFGPR